MVCFHNLIVYRSSPDIQGGNFKNIFAEPNIIGLHGAYILLELGWKAHDKLVMIQKKVKMILVNGTESDWETILHVVKQEKSPWGTFFKFKVEV